MALLLLEELFAYYISAFFVLLMCTLNAQLRLSKSKPRTSNSKYRVRLDLVASPPRTLG